MNTPTMHTVLVTVREGRHFHLPPTLAPATTKLYAQCRFNNEILTTDPTPFSHDPVWDTDLAWQMQTKPLAFLRTQRAKLKLACFAIDTASNQRVQIGYIMLDLRTASSLSTPKWNADPEVEKDAAWGWYPLINTSTGGSKTPSAVFRPEIKLAFSVAPLSSAQANSPAATGSLDPRVVKVPGKKARVLAAAGRGVGGARKGSKSNASVTKPVVLGSPKMIRLQLYPDAESGRSSPPTTIQQNQNQTLFTTTSGLPIELTPTGCYQIGFNGPNWLLNFTIAFAENLSLLSPPSTTTDNNPDDREEDESAGYYFSYTFLGNSITTTPFLHLANPVFPSERISFRIRASEHELTRFLADVEVLVVCLCRAEDGSVLGFTEVPFAGVMESVDDSDVQEGGGGGGEENEGMGAIESRRHKAGEADETSVSRTQSPTMERVFRSSNPQAILGRKRACRVLEKVTVFYDAREELPVSGDGKVAGLGVSVIIVPDLQADLVEVENGGPQQSLLGTNVAQEGEGQEEAYERNEFELFEEEEEDEVGPSPRRSPEFAERRVAFPEELEEGFVDESGPLRQPQPMRPNEIPDGPYPFQQQQQQQQQQQPLQQQPIYSYQQQPQPIYTQQQQPQPNQQSYTQPQDQPILQPTPHPAPTPQWHQYRFSIDLRSIHSLSPTPTGTLTLKYTYPPFGTTAPISTHPPIQAARATTTLTIPHAFTAFEFVMGPQRLMTYLEAVPLSIEMWVKPDRYTKDMLLGLCTVDLSRVMSEGGGGGVHSADLLVPMVSTTGSEDPDAALASPARVKKAGMLRVVVSLEDFGPVPDDTLLEQQTISAAPKQISPRPLRKPIPSPHRGASPTFTTLHHHRAPSPSESSGSSESLHETQEYRAALEIAVWKKTELVKFKQHLSQLEQNLVQKLTREFQDRDAARSETVRVRVAELETLETGVREILGQLESREVAVRRGEEEVGRRRDEVERYVVRKEQEVEDLSRRLGEEFRTRVELERGKGIEAEAGRVRAVKERDEIERKLKKVEEEYESYRKSVISMGAKLNGPGGGEEAVASVRRELREVVALNKATERRAEQLEASKRHYKSHWIRTLRDLASTKKALQLEVEDRLRRGQREMESAKVRWRAQDERGAMENERSVVDGMRREIERLKKGVEQQQNESDKAETRRVGGERGEKTGEAAGMLKPSQAANLDPRVVAEIERLVNERDSLVNTGVYSREDGLIRELDMRIGNLLRAR
ncbi:hypothetical protein HDU98_001492 [Podochytrium sp. JEL0797]|nr:hypothetical protein HDU98_001492 [Podochytrium sp. JEL0797]